MSKHWSLPIIVTALAIVAALVLPGCSNGNPDDYERVTVLPGYWWRIHLTEEGFHFIGDVWGKNLTIREFVDMLWPEVVPELPSTMVEWMDRSDVDWGRSCDWDDVLAEMSRYGGVHIMGVSQGMESEEGLVVFDVFAGDSANEAFTLSRPKEWGVCTENTYRSSLRVCG